MMWRRIAIDRYKCSKCHQLVWSRWGTALTSENAWDGQLLHEKRENCHGGQPVPYRTIELLPLVEVRAPEQAHGYSKRNQT